MKRPPQDTLRFDAPASARRCGVAGHGGILLQGTNGGNGVLLWLRFRDSLAGESWPLLQRADTATPRGAVVGLRFMVGDVAHGVPLDSGAVSLRRAGPVLTASVRASGLEVATIQRVVLEAAFEAVPLENDTVPCQASP